MYKRVIFGDIANAQVALLHDLNRRERVVLGMVAAMVVLFGVWPAPLLEVMHPSVTHLLDQIAHSKLP